MPPRIDSRYLSSYGVKDSDDRVYLTERKPFRYDPKLQGTRRHVATGQDTLWSLAYTYFKPRKDAEHLWWVIADFQPVPIKDATLDIAAGRVLYIPSNRILEERILVR